MAPYLTLMTEDAPQRKHDLRRVFDALKYVVRSGVPWRFLPSDFPPWAAVYQQAIRWLAAGVFEALTQDLSVIMRYGEARKKTPSGVLEIECGERVSGRLRWL